MNNSSKVANYNKEIILKLIEDNSDVDKIDAQGLTPLLWAVQEGDEDLVSKLIDKGANLNSIYPKGGLTPIMKAILKKKPAIVTTLIDKGADLDIQNQNGNTALITAIVNKVSDIAIKLIDKGANINIKNKNSDTALSISILVNLPDIANILIDKGANINDKNTFGDNPLILAISRNLPDIANRLIDKGADVNVQDSIGDTALMYAVSRNLPDIVDKLIERGANINIQNKNGYNAVMLAIKEYKPDILNKLIDKDINLDVQDEKGNTLLMLAIIHKLPHIAIKLIDKGANMDIQETKNGNTALIYATMHNLPDVAIKLIDKGAKLDLENKHGHTALTYAVMYKLPDIANKLIEKGAKVSKNSHIKNYDYKVHKLIKFNRPPVIEINNEKKKGFPEKFSNMVPNAVRPELGGSTGAKLYLTMNGRKWVVKKGLPGASGFLHIVNEYIANDVYEAFGVAVPKHLLYTKEKALVLEYIEGDLLRVYMSRPYPVVKPIIDIIAKDFIFDALLSNWDVIGSEWDNIIIKKDGNIRTAFRIDNGGTFKYRAQGAIEKTKFTGEVSEIITMRNPDTAKNASTIFGHLTNKDILDQIGEKIIPLASFKDISSLNSNVDIKNMLKSRILFLLSLYNLQTVLTLEGTTKYNSDFTPNRGFKNDYSRDITPISTELLSYLDIMAIRFYTGVGFQVINNFMYEGKVHAITNLDRRAEEGISKSKFTIMDYISFKVDLSKNDPKYNELLYFYYFIYLYNIIKKSSKISEAPFTLYRGTKTWYLDKSTDHFSYITSFCSTSLDKYQSLGFTDAYKKMYVFYIHPETKYMDIADISIFPHEQEVLIQPYSRCKFVKEEIIDDVEYQRFIIIPSDIVSDIDFNKFIEFRNSLKGNKGGRSVQYNRTRKLLSNKIGKEDPMNQRIIKPYNQKTSLSVKNTRKNSMNKSKYNLQSMYSRFAEPIYTVKGKEPTPKERVMLEQIANYFTKRGGQRTRKHRSYRNNRSTKKNRRLN